MVNDGRRNGIEGTGPVPDPEASGPLHRVIGELLLSGTPKDPHNFIGPPPIVHDVNRGLEITHTLLEWFHAPRRHTPRPIESVMHFLD